MAMKSTVAILLAVCSIQCAAAQTQYFSIGSSRPSDSSEEAGRRVTYVQEQPRRVVYVDRPAEQSTQVRYRPAPAPQVTYQAAPAVQRVSYRQRDSEGYGYGNDDAKYQFAYRVVASGKGAGYGDSREGGYGGATQEFGHSESRDGSKTTGAYFVQLPDGRLQRVDYYVDGNSGYVARVSYSGADGKGYSADQSSEK